MRDELCTDIEGAGTLTSRAASGAAIAFVGDFMGKGIYFISQIVIARILGVELFGIYALVLVVFNIAQTISIMGLSQGALKFVAVNAAANAPGRLKATVIQTIGLSTVAGAIICAIIFGLSSVLGILSDNALFKPSIRLAAIGVPFMAGMMVGLECLRGLKKMQYFVYVKNLLHPIANILLFLMLYLQLGMRLEAAVVSWSLACILGITVCLYFIWKEFRVVFRSRAEFHPTELLRFSFPLLLVGLLQMLFVKTDILMLGYFSSPDDIGVYNAASQLLLPIGMVLAAFTAIFSPLAAELHAQRKHASLNRLLAVTAKWTFLLTIPVFIIIFVCPKEVLVFFGSGFARGSLALQTLCLFFFLSVVLGPITSALIMTGRQSVEFVNALGSLSLNILLNWILIPKFGLMGAATATGISVLGLHIVRLVEVLWLERLWPLTRDYFIGVIAILAVASMAVIVKHFLSTEHSVQTLIVISSVVFATFAAVVAAFGLNSEERLVLSAAKRRVTSLWR